ncbi:MAG: glycosyltransferase family 4 protein [Anaerolineae bacterium]|nr:glycosyltransferase family 4 protein [Anaerolineae bacterium]
MLSVGINAHLLSGQAGYRRAGIHTYIAQVLQRLPSDNIDYTIFTGPNVSLSAESPLSIVNSHWPTHKRLARIAWEQTAWPLENLRRKIDLLHSMAFVTPLLNRIPAIITVYDLSFMHYPERFPRAQRLYLQTQTRRSVQRAQRIVTISKAGRDDVHHFFGIPLERIEVIYPGVDKRFDPVSAEMLADFKARVNPPKRFILHVGTLQPRKNIPTLIDAFSQLPDQSIHLVLVGGKGWLYDDIFARVAELGMSNRVHFTGYVADDALPLWYQSAAMLVFPSVYEGFGLPVVEAMRGGTPVIAANTSSIPEVAGNAALMFNPHDSAELAHCMQSVLNDQALCTTMIRNGKLQAQKYTWTSAANNTAALYRSVAAQNNFR